jgi:hypothetical protein
MDRTTTRPPTALDLSDPRPSLPVTTRRLLAAAVVVAPLLIAINSLFHPEVELSGAGFLAGAQTDPSGWFVVHVVAASGALLGVPAAIGLHTLVRGSGRRIATFGGALTLLAGPILALGFASEASVLRLRPLLSTTRPVSSLPMPTPGRRSSTPSGSR